MWKDIMDNINNLEIKKYLLNINMAVLTIISNLNVLFLLSLCNSDYKLDSHALTLSF